MSCFMTSNSQVLQRIAWLNLPVIETYPYIRDTNKEMISSEHTRKVKAQDNIFYNDVKPVFNILRFMGVLPLYKSSKGWCYS